MLKKLLALLLVFAMLFSMTAFLTGCEEDEQVEADDTKDDDSEDKDDAEDKDDKDNNETDPAVPEENNGDSGNNGDKPGNNDKPGNSDNKLNLSDYSGISVELKPVLTKEGQALVESLAGQSLEETGIDADAINDLTVYLQMQVQEEMGSANAGIVVGGDKAELLKAILDISNEKLYIGSPDLSDTYLYTTFDLEEMIAAMESAADPEMMEKLEAAIPDADVLVNLLDKYLQIALDNIPYTENKNAKLTVDGVSQKCTEAVYSISEETAVNVVVAIMEEARDDQELKKIIENLQPLLEEMEGYDGTDLYEAFVDTIDEALATVPTEFESTEILEIVCYTSGGNLLGVSISFDNQEYFRLAAVEDGSNFALELEVWQQSYDYYTDDYAFVSMLRIEGNGTNVGGIVNADYTVSMQEMELVTISVSDFNESALLNNGQLKGTFDIKPSAALLENMGLNLADTFSPVIRLVVDASDTKAQLEIYLCNNKIELAGFILTVELIKADPITIPSDSIEITESGEEVQDWLDGLDLSKIEKLLRNLGLPEDAIDDFIEGFEESLPGDANDYDEYYDEYYDDYYYDF